MAGMAAAPRKQVSRRYKSLIKQQTAAHTRSLQPPQPKTMIAAPEMQI